MTQVGIADVADHLSADHAVTSVALFADPFGIDGVEIAGPAAACIKLGVRGKQGGTATDATVNAGGEIVPIAAGKGAFGTLEARDGEFVGTELVAPFGIGFIDFLHDVKDA